MTAGADGKTIDGMSIDRVEQLIGSLKNETYQPNPSKRTYIPKKNGKTSAWHTLFLMISWYRK